MKLFHDAPHFQIQDKGLIEQFLTRFSIDRQCEKNTLIGKVATAFSWLPYENLTKIIKSDGVVNARSAMRFPDELVRDFLLWGTGGTCFSLTAAIIAIYNELDIEAHPLLADRHYGPDTHCGLVIVTAKGLLLLDPGYLLFAPTLLPCEQIVTVHTGDNVLELKPLEGGSKVELHTAVKGNRKLRLTYKVNLVDAEGFARAWENSFAWEMMSYPVLTRRTNDVHLYVQGDRLRVRSQNHSETRVLTADTQGEVINQYLGINKDIVSRALGVIKNGKTPSADTR